MESELSAGLSTLTALIVFIIVGGIAGWLAGLIVKGTGFGLVGDIVVGILGGIIAGYLLRGSESHSGQG